MSPRYSSAAAAAVALLAGIGSAWLVGSRTEVAAADVSRGTEEAFASGLHPRELLPQHGPLRWTRPDATLRFLHVPSGPAHVDVAIAGHRTPVRVVVDGVVEEVLRPGEDRVDFQVTVRRGRLDIVLETEGFVASGGRRLGTQLRRVAVTTPGRLTGRVASYFATGSLAVALGALAVGCGAGFAAALGSVMAGVIALTLWPGGALWSGYTASLWGQVLALALLATLFARWQSSRVAGSGPCAFAAILIAGVVQGIWATHPAMVVSDAVFHANRLVAVAGGDLFPTSVTQHATPFHFPYGVSFYLLLAPFARAGIDPVWLVRWGAGISGLVMSAGLFLLLRHRPAVAMAAVCGLQLMPGVFDVYSFGNLSNVFAQSLTVLLFAWWASPSRASFVGAALVALAALAHLSGLIVLIALTAALLWMNERDTLWRSRLWAALGGLAIAAGYYGSFSPMILEQLPRLLEGGGQGRGASIGLTGTLRLQLIGAIGQWGLPVLLLAWWGRPRRPFDHLDQQLAAFWLAGSALFFLALVSPLEVRYIYALSLPVAVAAARGLFRLYDMGPTGRAAAWLLVAGQIAIAGHGVVEAVLHRYRP